MSRNQKLAPLLHGRVITAVEPPAPSAQPPASPFAPSQASTWHVRFGDGSVLAVRTDGTPLAGVDRAPGTPVADVTQRGTTLTLALGPAATPAAGAPAAGAPLALVFHTAEASACVMLRDGKGAMEYAD